MKIKDEMDETDARLKLLAIVQNGMLLGKESLNVARHMLMNSTEELSHCRDMPRNGNDWKAVDAKLSVLTHVLCKANAGYSGTMLRMLIEGSTKDGLTTALSYAVNCCAILSILSANSELSMAFERDTNADFYYDKIMNLLETKVTDDSKMFSEQIRRWYSGNETGGTDRPSSGQRHSRKQG